MTINNLWRKKSFEDKLYKIILSLDFISVPISTRDLAKIFNVDSKTIRYYFSKDKSLFIKYYTKGFILSSKGKKLISNSKKKIQLTTNEKFYLNEIKKKNYYYLLCLKSWKKKLNESIINDFQDKFDWYNLPDSNIIPVNFVRFNSFLQNLKKNLQITSDRKLSLLLGENEKIINNYSNQKNFPSVKTLKKICNLSNIPFEHLSGFFLIKFPIIIDSRILELRTHIYNEGSIQQKSVAVYHNYDPVLHYNYWDNVFKLGFKNFFPKVSKNDIYMISDKFTTEFLKFVGLPEGKKNKFDVGLHCLQKTDPHFFRRHLQITFAEEGIFHLKVQRMYNKNYINFQIGISRSVDVSECISINEKKTISLGFTKFTQLSIGLQNKILKKRSLYLDDEVSTFFKFEKIVSELSFPKPKGVYKTLGGEISCYWEWRTENLVIIEKIQSYLFPNSWNAFKVKKLYKLFLRIPKAVRHLLPPSPSPR